MLARLGMRSAKVVVRASLLVIALVRVSGATENVDQSGGAEPTHGVNPDRDQGDVDRAPHIEPAARRGGDVELMASAFVGDGLRFNNPYRLATPLGASAQSISRTAAYTDLGFAALLGDPIGFRSGVALRFSTAIEGVPQVVMTPSYVGFHRERHWAAYGRFGTPLVLTPSITWGVEGSVGVVWLVRGGVGIAAEMVGDLFYGAGTREVATPAYPVLSGQLGLIFDYEVLP